MRKLVVLLYLGLFAMTLNGCSLFSSEGDEQETATVAEESSGEEDFAGIEKDYGDEGEFGNDSFEDGDLDTARAEINNIESGDDFNPEAMAKGEEEAQQQDDLFAEDVVVEDNNFGADDAYPDDDYGKEAAATAATDPLGDSSAGDDFLGDSSLAGSSSESLFVDEGGGELPADTLAGNQEEDLFGQDMEPVVDEPVQEPLFADSGPLAMNYDAPQWVPVKKMKPAAYKRAGGNVNRLYVARNGDDMNSIAEKIYGNSGSADRLYAYNSHFNGKSLKVGDKVYYESPNNPNDPTMMTYYEDNNIEPQYYTSSEGDNIRKVSQKLLGHPRSWMEVWATNSSVESKGRLPAGLQLRYWPEGAVEAPVMAAAPAPEPIVEEEAPAVEPVAPPPVEEVAAVEPEDMDVNDLAEMDNLEEPVTDVAMNDPAPVENLGEDGLPPVEEVQDVDINESDLAELDEPGAFEEPQEMANPEAAIAAATVKPKVPPPPPPAAPPAAPKSRLNKPAPPKVNMGGNDGAAMADDSMMLAALGSLLVLAAIIMLIFIRRSRAKRVNFSQTQV